MIVVLKNGELRKASELETLLYGGDLETNTTPKRRQRGRHHNLLLQYEA